LRSFYEEHVMTALDPQDPAAAGKPHANIVGMGVGDGPGPDVMAASTLEGNAPGFDKDNWPSMADMQWGTSVHEYYNRSPYWSATRDVVKEKREGDSNL
jgi:hypothetical protein